MVLEDTSQSTDTFANDAAPPDNDPYTDTQPSRHSWTIDYSALRKPSIPFFGAVPRSKQAVEQWVTQFEADSKPLSQEEAQCLATYYMTWMDQSAILELVGISAGIARWWQTKAVWKFPFKRVNPNFNPDKFLFMRGGPSQLIWRSLRFASYAVVGQFLIGGTLQAMGTVSHIEALTREPRLKEIMELRRKKIADERQGKIHKRMVEQRGKALGDGSAGYPQRTGVAGSNPSSPDTDDMSPTAGNAPWTGSTYTTSDTGLMNDSQRTDFERQQESQSRQGASRQPTAHPWQQSQKQEDSSFDPDSPTGGFGLGDDAPNTSNAGSAWDRIRRGQIQVDQPQRGAQQSAPTGWQRNAQSEARSGSTVGDKFSFSTTDEERQLARAEAQKEFDAKLERERNGGDFEDRGKKW